MPSYRHNMSGFSPRVWNSTHSTTTQTEAVATYNWGVAKLVKAPDFDSGMRRFESFLPSQNKLSV